MPTMFGLKVVLVEVFKEGVKFGSESKLERFDSGHWTSVLVYDVRKRKVRRLSGKILLIGNKRK